MWCQEMTPGMGDIVTLQQALTVSQESGSSPKHMGFGPQNQATGFVTHFRDEKKKKRGIERQSQLAVL